MSLFFTKSCAGPALFTRPVLVTLCDEHGDKCQVFAVLEQDPGFNLMRNLSFCIIMRALCWNATATITIIFMLRTNAIVHDLWGIAT